MQRVTFHQRSIDIKEQAGAGLESHEYSFDKPGQTTPRPLRRQRGKSCRKLQTI
jgi:hypothetical protein